MANDIDKTIGWVGFILLFYVLCSYVSNLPFVNSEDMSTFSSIFGNILIQLANLR
ncbi:preprotein translocase subunit SecY [Methanococcus maripaludis]|uniref:Preprotein translocase subunit SecY n=1 Tax=Methanococcus maripaludis TaxID=39152 RepID=A0A7J9P7B7_METMI|nr:hypothetical protein [Methanococcus maripaludis]MBA2858694.1 preprotein translocase subunit SecY [Methanococcus maripaludis]